MHTRRAGQFTTRPLNCGVMRLIKLVAAFVCAIGLSQAAHGSDSVVWGRAVKNQALPDVESPCGEPAPDTICMVGWYRWTLVVDRTISGPSVAGRVVAANTQHTSVAPSAYRRARVFVLRPIDDPAERRRLRADYFLIDASWPHYCLQGDPADLGLTVDYEYVGRGDEGEVHCFPLPEE
jgi:hypothetical protein